MHKKRQILEKELLIEIQKELAIQLAMKTQRETAKREARQSSTSKRKNINAQNKSQKKDDFLAMNKPFSIKTSQVKKSSITKNRSSHGKGKRKEKLYCLCKTPYDDSR